MTTVNSSFFWKFSRDGDYSKTYISFILDVPQTNIILQDNSKFFQTTFDSLSNLLLLLQDVELFNKKQGQKSAGLNKVSYKTEINKCGYMPNSDWLEKRNSMNLVGGTASMGKHKGAPIDWGFFNNENEPIILDITNYSPIRNVEGKKGLCKETQDRDLLSCFRPHPQFDNSLTYWDFMPMHKHIPKIFNAMKSHNSSKADKFVQEILGWHPI